MSARKKQRKRYRQYLVNPNTPVPKSTYYRRQYEDSIMKNVADGDAAAANSQFFNETSPEVNRNIANEEFLMIQPQATETESLDGMYRQLYLNYYSRDLSG